jgi:hypothetical protein
MGPDDVKGAKPTRWWKVRNVDDAGNKLDLMNGDLLVYDAAASKMIRIRPTSPPNTRVDPIDDWGSSCAVTSPNPAGCDLEITGSHKKSGKPFAIQFKAARAGVRASHSGVLDPPANSRDFVPAGTWAADEGP